MKFKPGDICVGDPKYRIECYLIKGVHSNGTPIQYDVLSLKNNECRTYFAPTHKKRKEMAGFRSKKPRQNRRKALFFNETFAK